MHRVPEVDDRTLRTVLRLEDSDAIPPAVLDRYWAFKRVRDACMSSPLHPDVLAWLVFTTTEVPPDPPVNPIHELIKSGAVVADAPIEVTWRFGRSVTAKFRGYAQIRNSVMVLLPEESAERELPLDRVVGLPDAVEV